MSKHVFLLNQFVEDRITRFTLNNLLFLQLFAFLMRKGSPRLHFAAPFRFCLSLVKILQYLSCLSIACIPLVQTDVARVWMRERVLLSMLRSLRTR